MPTPIKQLAGFVEVALYPEELTTVAVSIPRRLFSYRDESAKRWRIAEGEITVLAGDSSGKGQLTGILTVQQEMQVKLISNHRFGMGLTTSIPAKQLDSEMSRSNSNRCLRWHGMATFVVQSLFA
jgi:hypothetical protein